MTLDIIDLETCLYLFVSVVIFQSLVSLRTVAEENKKKRSDIHRSDTGTMCEPLRNILKR